MFLALGFVLPFLTGQIPSVGNALLPMHIPILLCGIICGWKYGLTIGFILPLLRSLLFTKPPLIPVGMAMAFELATYGAIIGIVYYLLKKQTYSVFVALIAAMIAGRIVFGIATFVILGLTAKTYTLPMFFSATFITAIPGILLQIVLIPTIILLLRKANLLDEN